MGVEKAKKAVTEKAKKPEKAKAAAEVEAKPAKKAKQAEAAEPCQAAAAKAETGKVLPATVGCTENGCLVRYGTREYSRPIPAATR